MDIYLFFIVVLFALAISDLMVGVANDAINFLNSAIGSKVAPRYIILAVASLGIFVGATFSNGMMEVARKGLFYPDQMFFTEVIVIFMAVMFTDVLLLDFFNTFGLPTSTTVSLVFGILGAAFGIALIKVNHGTVLTVNGVEKVAEISDFINSTKALAIVSSILLSVVLSFIFGIIVQWISRLIFSFNTQNTIRIFGSVWSGLAIAAITYFILIKGLKDASFMSKEAYANLKDHTSLVLTIIFVGSTILLQLLYWIAKVNPLKVVVIMGTFSLALAFAGNDLVNFIGVPLAGFEAYKVFIANNSQDLLMVSLLKPVATETYLLVSAGLIMVVTLWFSRKARTVADTELNLSRQDEGSERFGSNAFSRMLVRRVITTGSFFSTVIPNSTVEKIKQRFDQTPFNEKARKEKNPPMFDLVRASVNLMVASILIAIGTSLKLPLSTTYVTFMVAMSTSLVDGAWGRDSAVYRITGVFSVIGGWFLTALAAFSVALGISLFLKWTGLIGVVIMVILSVLAFLRTHITHKRRSKETESNLKEHESSSSLESLIRHSGESTKEIYKTVLKIFSKASEALAKEDRKELKSILKKVEDLNEDIRKEKSNIHRTILKLQPENMDTCNSYIQILDFQRDIANSLSYFVDPLVVHVENQHRPITAEQYVELKELIQLLKQFEGMVQDIIDNESFIAINSVVDMQNSISEFMKIMRKNQVKRIKLKEVGSRNSNLYLNMLLELRKLMAFQVNMLLAYRDFVKQRREDME